MSKELTLSEFKDQLDITTQAYVRKSLMAKDEMKTDLYEYYNGVVGGLNMALQLSDNVITNNSLKEIRQYIVEMHNSMPIDNATKHWLNRILIKIEEIGVTNGQATNKQ